jgi:phosphohistidine phosphatase
MLDWRVQEIDAAAMRLMLLRHAKSEKGAPGMPDRARALNARGRKDAPELGAYLVHHALLPDRVIVSSARRTRETWERLALAFATPPAVAYDDRLYNAHPERILEVIMATDRAAHTLLVIGHNPGLHEVAGLLIASGDVAARERLNEGLPTSGLAVIDFAGGDWRALRPHGGRLERFVTPRSLKGATD